MRTMIVVVGVLALAAGCSKKKSDGPAAKPETGSQDGSGSAGATTPPVTPPPPAAKPAPAIAFADVVAAEPKWSIEAMDRGLWFSDNGAALVQKCRVELGMAMGNMGKY